MPPYLASSSLVYLLIYPGASIPPKTSGANPPNLIGHRSFMELDFSPWGNCKRRRREAATAEAKKPLATRGSWERRKLSHRVWGGAPETVRILTIFSCQKEYILRSS